VALSFPRQQARTRRFSLGVPHSFTVSPDGQRVVFLRSPAGDDPRTSLWCYDVASGSEAEVANPAELLGAGDEQVPEQERRRRERSRERAQGIVAYACDEAVGHAAFALGGRLWWADVRQPGATELVVPAGVVDPRPAPDGTVAAFLSGRALCVVEARAGGHWAVLAEEPGEVSWGAAEFVAAEEMGRRRGFWWGPDSRWLLATRVDESEVETWWTADPADPARPPQAHRYPVAGSPDAAVTLWLLEAKPGGERREVAWDRERFPYLVSVHWGRHGPPLALVEQRDHRASAVLEVGPATGKTSVLVGNADPHWVDRVPGLPAWAEGGRLVWAASDGEAVRLEVDGVAVTPPGLQLREVTGVGRSVLFSASPPGEPEVVEAWSWSPAGGLRQLTHHGGVCAAWGEGRVRVVVSRSMGWHGARLAVRVGEREQRGLEPNQEVPVLTPAVRFLRVGQRQLSVGVVLPSNHPGGKLPVVMSPYGGPGHQRVVKARSAWLEAQWLADQGFAVVVADGRGTPGRGPAWERAVYRDLAGPVLEDQVDALQGAAELVPGLDLDRVGIEGWSFGGYLAALAVLARPDVFHAAFAGAPVTDWRLYDTYYTERYLGHPAREPEAYERTSLIPLAPKLARPLALAHGLADDNVYAAHTLRLSAALLAAGRPHEVVLLPGTTHMASREDVAENLLVLEADFFRRALRPSPVPGPGAASGPPLGQRPGNRL